MSILDGLQQPPKLLAHSRQTIKARLSGRQVRAAVLQRCPILATPWTVVHQAPLSMGWPRQKDWSEWPFPSPGDLPR